MDNLDAKKRKKEELLELLKAKSVRHSRVAKLLRDIEKEINIVKEEFNTLDYELAMENRIILPSQKATVRKTTKSFTLDEIKSIAVKLGVEITIKDEDEK